MGPSPSRPTLYHTEGVCSPHTLPFPYPAMPPRAQACWGGGSQLLQQGCTRIPPNLPVLGSKSGHRKADPGPAWLVAMSAAQSAPALYLSPPASLTGRGVANQSFCVPLLQR